MHLLHVSLPIPQASLEDCLLRLCAPFFKLIHCVITAMICSRLYFLYIQPSLFDKCVSVSTSGWSCFGVCSSISGMRAMIRGYAQARANVTRYPSLALMNQVSASNRTTECMAVRTITTNTEYLLPCCFSSPALVFHVVHLQPHHIVLLIALFYPICKARWTTGLCFKQAHR